ncbi:MAG: DUF1292 domain-containing protein [Ruminococcaceae bacterium]|nr:DUF1292 domain-containing protein [Oscillospiraceae bacterium]
MAENNEFEFETESVTLTDEDGVEKNFDIIGTLELDGNTYFALVDAESDEDEYIILKSVIDENDDEILITIDDDDEFDRVADAFDNELMSEYDYDEE